MIGEKEILKQFGDMYIVEENSQSIDYDFDEEDRREISSIIATERVVKSKAQTQLLLKLSDTIGVVKANKIDKNTYVVVLTIDMFFRTYLNFSYYKCRKVLLLTGEATTLVKNNKGTFLVTFKKGYDRFYITVKTNFMGLVALRKEIKWAQKKWYKFSKEERKQIRAIKGRGYPTSESFDETHDLNEVEADSHQTEIFKTDTPDLEDWQRRF